MAETHLNPVVTTGIQFGHGSTPIPWQGDVDALKQEIDDLRTMVGSLVKEVEELKKVKVEAVSDVFFSCRHTLAAPVLDFASARQERCRSSSRRPLFLDHRLYLLSCDGAGSDKLCPTPNVSMEL